MSYKVLLVDDAAFIREILCSILESANFNVVGEAGTGPEAIAKAKVLKPDIIIMDLVMPGMTGLQAIQEIKRTHPYISFIACSSLSEDFVRQKALNEGCSAFLTKPFDKETVLKALNESIPFSEAQHG